MSNSYLNDRRKIYYQYKNLEKKCLELEQNTVSRKEIENEISKSIKRKMKTLRIENSNLRSENKDLKERYTKLIETKSRNIEPVQQPSLEENIISDVKIDQIINELLDDPDVNIYGLPDSLERMVYRKAFKMILSNIENFIKNTSITTFGHQIKMVIHPL